MDFQRNQVFPASKNPRCKSCWWRKFHLWLTSSAGEVFTSSTPRGYARLGVTLPWSFPNKLDIRGWRGGSFFIV